MSVSSLPSDCQVLASDYPIYRKDRSCNWTYLLDGICCYEFAGLGQILINKKTNMIFLLTMARLFPEDPQQFEAYCLANKENPTLPVFFFNSQREDLAVDREIDAALIRVGQLEDHRIIIPLNNYPRDGRAYCFHGCVSAVAAK